MGIIKFNNKSTEDLGIIIQFIPTYSFPEKEYDTIHIPGKNGDLVVDKGSYKNVERTYSIAKVFKPGQDFVSVANSIVSWLQSAKGYARLEDSYEPEYYRMAMFKSNGELSNFYDAATALDITFECKPQRWLISGEKELNIQNGDEIDNPTNYDASPIIKFTATPNENMTIKFDDIEVSIKDISESLELTIDCENMECYSNSTLYNSRITLINNKFPILKANTKTKITFSNVSNVKVTPRWWTL